LFSNVALRQNISSHEDVVPTAINLLGCTAQTKAYSTGSNLTGKNNLSYIVSTQGSKVILLTSTQRVEIMKNGNVSVFDLKSGNPTFKPVDTNLLSQGIKHLSRFSARHSISKN
jgi:membrane-anchored protein YejM (alkaline phosphatase superfamily)